MIIVTGAPRTGTSIVAGTLHRLGIDMGDTQTGRYESPAFMQPKTTMHEAQAAMQGVQGFKSPFLDSWVSPVARAFTAEQFVFCYRDTFGKETFIRSLVVQGFWAAFFKQYGIQPLLIHFDMPQAEKVALLATLLPIEPTHEQVTSALAFYDTERGYH